MYIRVACVKVLKTCLIFHSFHCFYVVCAMLYSWSKIKKWNENHLSKSHKMLPCSVYIQITQGHLQKYGYAKWLVCVACAFFWSCCRLWVTLQVTQEKKIIIWKMKMIIRWWWRRAESRFDGRPLPKKIISNS